MRIAPARLIDAKGALIQERLRMKRPGALEAASIRPTLP
jgi:hypothetical protein